MNKNILIILNTIYHVEVALSLWKSLKLIGYNPTIFILWPNAVARYKLCEYLLHYNIDFITDYVPGVCRACFSKAIIVSAYPTIDRPDAIPGTGHPLLDEFKDEDKILIAHRIGMDKPVKSKILCVTPLAKQNNLDFIYLCENPTDDDYIEPFNYPIKFLIQGNFFTNRRDLHLIEDFFYKTKCNNSIYHHFVFIGNNKGNSIFNFNHPSIVQLENLSEYDFYKEVRNCHFILPLISSKTGNSTYTQERLSSSLSLAFCFNKPMVIAREINEIYKAPALEYSNSDEFVSNITELIKYRQSSYDSLVGYCKKKKEELRERNFKILVEHLN